jgi:hypothetical protein
MKVTQIIILVTILRTGQMPAQIKLAHLVRTMAGSGLKSAQRKILLSANELSGINRWLTWINGC